MILDRYVVRIFLGTLALVLLFVLGMYVVIDLIGKVDSVLEGKEALEAHGRTVLGVVAEYYLLSLPFFYLRLAPFLTLIAATVALLRLMRANEITPMMAAGRSPTRIALPIFVVAAICSAGMLLIQEYIVPLNAPVRSRLSDMMGGDFETEVDDLSPIRDDAGNTFNIDYYYPASDRIAGVLALRFRTAPDAPDLGILTVDVADWEEDGADGPGWYPSGAVIRPVDREAGFLSPRLLPSDRRLPTSLSLEQVRVEYLRRSSDPALTLSLSEAARIVRLYPDVPEQAVVFHSLITWPLANLLLLLLGLPLVLRFRKRNLLFGIGAALLLCAAYFGVTQICRDLGKRAELNPAVAVWLPVVLFTSLAAAILDFQRGPRPRRTAPR